MEIHKCSCMNEAQYTKEKQGKLPKGLYLPQALSIQRVRKQWLLSVQEEYAFPIRFCPFCSVALK